MASKPDFFYIRVGLGRHFWQNTYCPYFSLVMLKAFVVTLLWLMSWLPLPAAHALGWLIGNALWLLPNKQRHISRVNIRLCCGELSEPERRQLVRKSLIENAKSFMELGIMWFGRPARIRRLLREIENEDLFLSALSQDSATLLAFPHFGAWEAATPYLTEKTNISTLYRPPRQAGLESVVVNRRSRTGMKLLRADNQGVRALFKTLRAGQTGAILPDQQPKKGDGVFAPFFGTPALTMVLFSKIAAHFAAPTLFGAVERLSWGRGFRLHFLAADDEIFSKDLAISVAALNRDVERCARLNLAQYQWAYKRFGRRPQGDNSKIY